MTKHPFCGNIVVLLRKGIFNMDKILNFLTNPLFAVFLTLLFGILAIILYYHSPPKVIKCLISSNKLIDNTQSQFSNLSILYRGKQVEKLIVSKITFWNSSFSTIRKEDLIEKSPFFVTIDDGEILEISVLNGKDTPNQVNADFIDNYSAKISFDYLDHKEGGIIQVVHTGNQEVNISKKLMGGKIVKKYTGIDISTVVFGIIGLVLIFFIVSLYHSNYDLKMGIRDVLFVILIFSLILTIIIFVNFSIYYDKEYLPKNCKKKKENKKNINIVDKENKNSVTKKQEEDK